MPAPALTPSAVCPVPPEFDVEARIQMLEGMIQDPNTKQDQKPNLQLAIDLYKREELPTYGLVYFQDGKVITRSELHGRSSWWLEVCVHPESAHIQTKLTCLQSQGIGRQPSQTLIGVDCPSKEPENVSFQDFCRNVC